MNKFLLDEYSRLAVVAITGVMQDHDISIFRFRQYSKPNGELTCGSILQCTNIHGEELLDYQELSPLIHDLEKSLSQIQKETTPVQGNYSCYLIPQNSELPGGIQYQIAEGGGDLTVELLPRDLPDTRMAFNFGLSCKSTIYTYIAYSE